jgi:hypothetical protein
MINTDSNTWTDSDTWIDALSTIYADLLQRQEPLGSDFDKALFTDIEKLYEE